MKGRRAMAIIVKPSDLKFRYSRDVTNRDRPKFAGLPDPSPFNREDMYEILPMMGAALDTLGSNDEDLLHLLEDILNDMPRFVTTREEVFDYLVGSASECLRP
jgi:hypothetical protein